MKTNFRWIRHSVYMLDARDFEVMCRALKRLNRDFGAACILTSIAGFSMLRLLGEDRKKLDILEKEVAALKKQTANAPEGSWIFTTDDKGE